jgi:hypothetical protein
MLPKVQVFAIAGFDEAVIGTALRNGHEVLVYDGYIAEAIVAALQPELKSLSEYLDSISLSKLGDKAPVFVYLDEDVVGELTTAKREPGTPLH